MNIRPADKNDVEGCFALALSLAKETPTFQGFDFNPMKAVDFILEHILNDNQLIVVAENDDRDIVGVFMASSYQTFFGSDVLACDDTFYVESEYRQSGVLDLFLNAYHEWAEEINAKAVYLGVSLGINNDVVVPALERRGYEKFGQQMRRKPDVRRR